MKKRTHCRVQPVLLLYVSRMLQRIACTGLLSSLFFAFVSSFLWVFTTTKTDKKIPCVQPYTRAFSTTGARLIMRCCGSTGASMVAQDHAESSLCLFCSGTIALHCWSRGAVSNLMRTLTVLPAAHRPQDIALKILRVHVHLQDYRAVAAAPSASTVARDYTEPFL